MVRIPTAPPPVKSPARRTPASSNEPLVVPFTIQFDRRERTGGWTFDGLTGDSRQKYRPLVVPTQEIHMLTADYTVADFDVYIERKSHSDFIGSLGGGHANLQAEFERMQTIIESGGHCCMVVESSLDKIMEELESPTSARKLEPSSVLGMLATWPRRYGVPIHFAGSRRLAELLAYRIMAKYVEDWTA